MTSKKPKANEKKQSSKSAKPAKTKAQSDEKMSILDAAARVLKESGQPMTCKSMIERMLAAKYWQTAGKTPAATLSSAVLREIKDKGKGSRFSKVDRGMFSLA